MKIQGAVEIQNKPKRHMLAQDRDGGEAIYALRLKLLKDILRLMKREHSSSDKWTPPGLKLRQQHELNSQQSQALQRPCSSRQRCKEHTSLQILSIRISHFSLLGYLPQGLPSEKSIQGIGTHIGKHCNHYAMYEPKALRMAHRVELRCQRTISQPSLTFQKSLLMSSRQRLSLSTQNQG